jgi:hypothetical protein
MLLLVMSSWVVGVAVLGDLVALLGLVAFPIGASLLALSWVQPRPAQEAPTVVLAIVGVPLAVWFAGSADEYRSEALISGSALVAIVGLMSWMRRSGSRRAG